MIDGPIQLAFMYCGPRGSPRDQSSSPRIASCHGVARLPPYSSGQCGISQLRSASMPAKRYEYSAFSRDPSTAVLPCQ